MGPARPRGGAGVGGRGGQDGQDGQGRRLGAVWARAGALHHHIAGRMQRSPVALGEAASGDGRGGGLAAAF